MLETYITSFTRRHEGDDLDIHEIRSSNPFPFVSVGHFIGAGSIPPAGLDCRRYEVVEVLHEAIELADDVRYFTRIIMTPADHTV